MRNIRELSCPSGRGDGFACAEIPAPAGKTETITTNLPWLKVRDLRQKKEEDDQIGKVGFDSAFAQVPLIDSPRGGLISGPTYPVPASGLA